MSNLKYELYPVRCTCNRVLANKQRAFEELIEKGYSKEEALNILELNRSCCRLKMLEKILIPVGIYQRPELIHPEVKRYFEFEPKKKK